MPSMTRFTSVQEQESKNIQDSHPSFREECLDPCIEEYYATWDTYCQLDGIDGKTRIDLLEDCRIYAWFTVNLQTRMVRIATNSCRLRWCPVCSRALSKFRENSLGHWVVENDPCRFLTLTLKHTDDSLSCQIDRIYKSFSKLRKRSFFKKLCTGGIWFFQILRSKQSGQWHPHIHCLISGEFIPHRHIVEHWSQITGGSSIVDIRPIRDVIAVSKYVARYSSRPAQLEKYNNADRREIVLSLEGRRLCGKWGTGRSCELSNKLKVDISAWREIGKYTTVNESRYRNRLAKLIWKCWKTGRPLPPNTNISIWDKPFYRFTVYDLPQLTFVNSFNSGNT